MNINNLIGSPIIFEQLEMSEFDFEKSTWLVANEISKSIGDNWRLPTIKELELIYFNSKEDESFFKMIATQRKFIFSNYWSSSEEDRNNVMVFNFLTFPSPTYPISKLNLCNYFLVRNIKNTPSNEVIQVFKLNNFEIEILDNELRTWYESENLCKKKGENWRLPTFEELVMIKESEFSDLLLSDDYWSSTECNPIWEGKLIGVLNFSKYSDSKFFHDHKDSLNYTIIIRNI